MEANWIITKHPLQCNVHRPLTCKVNPCSRRWPSAETESFKTDPVVNQSSPKNLLITASFGGESIFGPPCRWLNVASSRWKCPSFWIPSSKSAPKDVSDHRGKFAKLLAARYITHGGVRNENTQKWEGKVGEILGGYALLGRRKHSARILFGKYGRVTTGNIRDNFRTYRS